MCLFSMFIVESNWKSRPLEHVESTWTSRPEILASGESKYIFSDEYWLDHVLSPDRQSFYNECLLTLWWWYQELVKALSLTSSRHRHRHRRRRHHNHHHQQQQQQQQQYQQQYYTKPHLFMVGVLWCFSCYVSCHVYVMSCHVTLWYAMLCYTTLI